MPIVLNPDQMPVFDSGIGWIVRTLADGASMGVRAMTARYWTLSPDGKGPEHTHGDQEQLLYVIRGSGSALVNGETLPLEPETVLWLAPGDTYRFSAGGDGLEILQGYAPGD